MAVPCLIRFHYRNSVGCLKTCCVLDNEPTDIQYWFYHRFCMDDSIVILDDCFESRSQHYLTPLNDSCFQKSIIVLQHHPDILKGCIGECLWKAIDSLLVSTKHAVFPTMNWPTSNTISDLQILDRFNNFDVKVQLSSMLKIFFKQRIGSIR